MLADGAINYGVYAWSIISFQFVMPCPIIGVAAASLSGMAVKFGGSRFLLYQFVLHRESQGIKKEQKAVTISWIWRNSPLGFPTTTTAKAASLLPRMPDMTRI